MKTDLQDIMAFLAVAEAGGFREGGRLSGVPATSLSEAVRRLEARLGVSGTARPGPWPQRRPEHGWRSGCARRSAKWRRR